MEGDLYAAVLVVVVGKREVSHHALVVGRDAFCEDCVAQLCQILFRHVAVRSFEEQHIQVCHGDGVVCMFTLGVHGGGRAPGVDVAKVGYQVDPAVSRSKGS